MKSFFRPAYLKEAELLAVNARKLLHRKRDVLKPEQYNSYSEQIGRLEALTRDGSADRKQVEDEVRKVDKSFGTLYPHDESAGWRENCEVLLVAFVLAIAIRSYFLQPFKIPTGSMEPTLNGIVGHPMPVEESAPNIIKQGLQSLWLGRFYVDAVSAVNDDIIGIKAEKKYGFMDYSRITCRSGRSYLVHAAPDTLEHQLGSDGFGLYPGKSFKAGEHIVHGYVDTGDQVFVDKFTYNFRLPHRGDVFVFDTKNIPGTRQMGMDERIHSEYYIKRLAGVPGDVLRIDHPKLYINGSLAEHPGQIRVMSAKDGYRGYSNMPGLPFQYLRTAKDTFTVPAESYFALGDNSYNSSDSRVWGRVPAENVVGRGLFVYWPFTRHWGAIR